MSAPYSNLESKIEAAAKAIHSGTDSYVGLCGLDSGVKPASGSFVLFHVEKGSEAPLNSGNYKCKLTVTVMDNADLVTLANHRAGSAAVFDLFLDDNLVATLSDEVDDFTVLLVTGRDGSSTKAEERQWMSEISIELYACAADIS